MLTRRHLLGCLTAATACSTKLRRPNILLVLADDQSWGKVAATPAFDRLCREGVRFTNSFSASPSCTPSRSAILMGRHVWQQREAGVLYGSMPTDVPLYTHRLEDAGYHTGYTGKGWQPGNWRALGLTRNPCGREYNSRRHAEALRPGLEPADYAENFRQFLAERPAGAPFCFWLGSKEPHRAYDPGSGLRLGKNLADAQVPAFLPDTPEVRSDLLDYYAEIEWHDQQLARTLQILEATGELDNTLIVATSDNGMPFPRAKTTLYDWGVHMPMAIRWGRVLKPGRVCDEMISHVELAPTFLEAAGLPAEPGMAGRSLVDVLTSDTAPKRERIFTAMERHTICRPDFGGYPMRAVRTKQFLYIRNYEPDRWPTGGEFESSNRNTHGDIDAGPTRDVVVERGDKLCLGKRPAEELYDVGADAAQVTNLAADPAFGERLADLRQQLEAYLKQTNDPRMDGKDPWVHYVYNETEGFGAGFNTGLPEAVRKRAREKPRSKPQ